MTSQRFLNDKVNSRDFLRSLLEECKAPIITLMFVSFYTVGAVATFAKNLKKNIEFMELLKNREIISYFGGATSDYDYKDTTVLGILMILCGIAVAISLFSFIFKKNSVNVYFSMGITRTRLFLNRVAAGATGLFVISFIPYLIVFLTNVGMFGFHSHQLKLFAYYTALMFIRGMSGFAIGTFAAVISGSVIETFFSAGSASIIFRAAAALLSGFKNIFLPGYVSNYNEENKMLLLTPWTALLEDTNYSDLITGKKVPENYLLTWKTDFFPIALWAVFAVIILAVTLFLFKKRKNENTASFGKYAIASGLNGACIFVISVLILAGLFSEYGIKFKSVPLCIILCTVISFVIFFIAELIIRRNFKAVLRILPVYGGLALATFASLIVIGTGYFGTFNKLPDVKEIEYVSMNYSDPLNVFNYNVNTGSPQSYDDKDANYCKSSNPEDIKLCVEQFNKIKNDKGTGSEMLRYTEFVIKTKDGKFIARRFPVYSEEISHNYDKAVFDSEYFHQILKLKLANNDKDSLDYEYNYGSYENLYGDKNQNSNAFYYFDRSLLSDNFNYREYAFNDDEVTPAYYFTGELKEALYNDLCKMTYDEYYGNNAEPIGAIAIDVASLMQETSTYTVGYDWLNFDGNYYNVEGESKDVIKTCIATCSILIYPQMTETLEQLEEIEPNPHKTDIKAVLCPDKKLSLSQALENLRDYYTDYRTYGVYSGGNESIRLDFYLSGKEVNDLFEKKLQGTYLDFIEIVYSAKDVNVTRVDDKAKAKQISDASRSVYDTYGDNGRFVFVIYEDGCVVPKYLPEKSLSVLS